MKGTWRAALGAAAVIWASALALGCAAEEPPPRALTVPQARESALSAVRDLRAIVKARSCDRMAGRWHTANGPLDDGTCFYLFRRLGALPAPVISAARDRPGGELRRRRGEAAAAAR